MRTSRVLAVRTTLQRWSQTQIARWLALVTVLGLLHQWLGQRFSNTYFSGDTLEFLSLGSQVATHTGDGLRAILESKSPISVLFVSAFLRISHASVVHVDGGTAMTAHGYVHVLAALATLVALLTGLLAWRYTRSARVGMLAILLAGLYVPFVISSERILTEVPFTLCVTAFFLCAHEAITRGTIGYSVLTGGGIILMIAARMQYLLPLLACTFLILGGTLGACAVAAFRAARARRAAPMEDEQTNGVRRASGQPLVVVGTITLSLIAFLAVGAALVRTVPAEKRLGGLGNNLILQQSPYAYAITDGWARDRTYVPLAPAGASPVEADVATLTTSARSQRCAGTGYGTLACLALKSPGFTVERITLNEFRLWWYPHNDFHVEVGMVTALMPLYHRTLVAFGIIGLLLLVGQRRLTVLLALPILFVAAIFTMQHIEVRHTIPTMPFLITGAATLFIALGERIALWRRGSIPPQRLGTFPWPARTFAVTAAGAIALVIGARFLFMAHGATRASVLLTRVLPLVMLIGCGLALLFSLLPPTRLLRAVAILVAAGIVPIGGLPALRDTGDQWSVTLANARQTLVQKIILPIAPNDDESHAILLDVQAIDGDLADLTLTVNGHVAPPIRSDSTAVTLTQHQFPSYYTWQFDQSHGAHTAANVPQWVAVPIPAVWIHAGENDLALGLRADRPHPHAVRFFGQFSRADNDALRMPGLMQTSLWRWVFDGDPRIREPMTLSRTTRYSLYREGDHSSGTDLSPARGIQRGTYHIFLGTLTPAYYPQSGDVPVKATVAGQLTGQPPDAPVNMFWFAATVPTNARISILDEVGLIGVIAPGQATTQTWESARADIGYAAYDENPAALAATPAGAGRSGVFTVHLHHPAITRYVIFVVTSRESPLGATWEMLIPPRTDFTATVDVFAPGTLVRNFGAPPPAQDGAGQPPFIMLSSGVQPDTALARASALLGIAAPSATILPVSAPNMRRDETPAGPVQSFWAYADLTTERTRAYVLLSLS